MAIIVAGSWSIKYLKRDVKWLAALSRHVISFTFDFFSVLIAEKSDEPSEIIQRVRRTTPIYIWR